MAMVGSLPIPAGPDEITAGWLTDALRAGGNDVTVGDVSMSRLGEGVGLVSDLVRLSISYSSGDGPSSLIFKGPAGNVANRAVANMFDLYGREVGFYRDIAALTTARTPRVYFAEIDGDEFGLLLEDLNGYEMGDQVVGCSVARAQAVMRWMGQLHATFWGRCDDPLLDFLPLVHPSYSSEALMQSAAMGWASTVEHFGSVVPDHIAALEHRFLAALPEIFAWMATGPITVIHGDVRTDNLLFGVHSDQEALIAVDWQGALRGRAAQDLGYFMSSSLTTPDRRTHERALIATWHDELLACGVTDYDWDAAWLDYRRGTLFVWTHAVVIAGTLDHANERGRESVTDMLRRSVAAFEDLALDDLLDELAGTP